jgi:hypothetical protein
LSLSGHVPQPRNFIYENKFSREDFLAICHRHISRQTVALVAVSPPHPDSHFWVAKNERQKTTAGLNLAKNIYLYSLRSEDASIPRHYLILIASGSSLLYSNNKATYSLALQSLCCGLQATIPGFEKITNPKFQNYKKLNYIFFRNPWQQLGLFRFFGKN